MRLGSLSAGMGFSIIRESLNIKSTVINWSHFILKLGILIGNWERRRERREWKIRKR